jgi:hypothetical protein
MGDSCCSIEHRDTGSIKQRETPHNSKGRSVEKVSCKVCRREIPDQERGRPAAYCGEACRRAAEMEIRRVNERLAGLEARLSECKLGPVQTFDDVGALEVEIGRQTARLLYLIEPVGR